MQLIHEPALRAAPHPPLGSSSVPRNLVQPLEAEMPDLGDRANRPNVVAAIIHPAGYSRPVRTFREPLLRTLHGRYLGLSG